jgi:preprotein translocase subunit SecE
MKMKNLLRRIGIFFGETVSDLGKASSPNQTEMRHSVGVMLVAMAILGFYVAIRDLALLHVVDLCGE